MSTHSATPVMRMEHLRLGASESSARESRFESGWLRPPVVIAGRARRPRGSVLRRSAIRAPRVRARQENAPPIRIPLTISSTHVAYARHPRMEEGAEPAWEGPARPIVSVGA